MTELIWTERRINRISQLYSIQLHRNFELLSFLSEYLKFRMSSFCCCGNWKNTDDAVLYFPCEAVHRRRNGTLPQASQLQNTLIRGKPIRFGYKIWTLSSANGYPYALKIYAGRDEREKILERPEKHELYFNNFFASYNLLEKLSGKMIRATGIMRNSRTRKILIMPVDEVKKKHRGFFDHVCNGTVNVCRWHVDVNVIT
ncbi:PiggyBac transposable element-derived protein [Trichinella pseudospiralis]